MSQDIKKEVITKDQREKIRKSISDKSTFSKSYLIMNILAGVIACYGLFANSAAVVIGAMVIAMLLGPIIGVSLALVDSNAKLLKRSLKTFLIGLISVFIVSIILGSVHKNLPLTNEIIIRTSPNFIDLMIAFAGGAAIAFATVSPTLSVALVGVAISTALVPPLAVAGLLIARGEFSLGFGALFLTFTNIVAIQFVSSAILWLTGFRRLTKRDGSGLITFLKRDYLSLTILIIISITLVFNFQNIVENQTFETETRKVLENQMVLLPGNILTDLWFEKEDGLTTVIAVVRGPKQPQFSQITQIEERLPLSPDGGSVSLHVRFVETTIINRDGYMYLEEDFPVE